MSSLPKNIRDSASQLFFQDKESLQYSASLVISCLSHPDRAILSCFVEDSVDPEEAARYFLRVTSPPDGSTASMDAVSDFLLTWKLLIGKFHPVEAHSLSTEDRDIVYKRDGGACCVTHTPFETVSDVDARYVHVVPPHVLEDPHLSKSSSVLEMLKVFISEESFKKIPLSAAAGPSSRQELDNVWLLSADAFETMRTGTIRFTVPRWENHTEPALKQCYMVKTNRFIPRRDYKTAVNTRSMTLENRTPEQASIVSKELLSLHARFSKSFAWIGTAKYIGVQFDPVSRPKALLPSGLCGVFRRIWPYLPRIVRAYIYDALVRAGLRLYGTTLSMTVYRLPFGLYLRRGSPRLASKYRVEANTLQMVEKLTNIPAPRAIDVLETRHFSYLLMTRVPGRPIGQMLDSMTDEQIEQAVVDLKRYISELRNIPKNTTSEFQICNSMGGGILDWRIPDSQREELRFSTESEFNKYLTDPLRDEIRKRAAVSHDVRHDIVFTHGDLNPRNILAENGKITGIVDWENAGWFPEYWEYTKSHYTVRSLIRWLADLVDQVFEGYRDELHVENMLSDLLGPF
ncbi:hypothetical protein FQN53_008152 [Emmonsiellopsis sp. PD_33]|nr:hypothetical protein FQN53_008152 [Emmonsiellopsis sp. PD_33]